MKKNGSLLKKFANFFYVLSAALMIAAMVVNVIPPQPVMAAVGAIWTTKTTCQTPDPVDENHYAIGESIYVRGDNFPAGIPFTFTIVKSNMPHKGYVMATGSGTTNPATDPHPGYFCIFAHTVTVNDYTGEYTTDVFIDGGDKNDNFQIDPPVATATNTPTNTVPPTATNTVPPTATNTVPPTATTPPENTPTTPPTATTPPENTPTTPPTATTPPENTPTTPPTATTPPESSPTPPPPPPPQITEQVLIPVTGADIHGGQFASSRLFLASIVSLGFGMVLSGMARKEDE